MTPLLVHLQQRLLQLDPLLYIRLQEEQQVTPWLETFLLFPDPEATLCAALSADRYTYLSDVLEEDFISDFLGFIASGILPYELVNIARECENLFAEDGYVLDQDNRLLRYAVIAVIAEYLSGGPEHGL